MKNLISLLEMMAKNNLSGWEEGTKIKHDSYLKGKGDALTEVITILKQSEVKDAISSANRMTKVDL